MIVQVGTWPAAEIHALTGRPPRSASKLTRAVGLGADLAPTLPNTCVTCRTPASASHRGVRWLDEPAKAAKRPWDPFHPCPISPMLNPFNESDPSRSRLESWSSPVQAHRGPIRLSDPSGQTDPQDTGLWTRQGTSRKGQYAARRCPPRSSQPLRRRATQAGVWLVGTPVERSAFHHRECEGLVVSALPRVGAVSAGVGGQQGEIASGRRSRHGNVLNAEVFQGMSNLPQGIGHPPHTVEISAQLRRMTEPDWARPSGPPRRCAGGARSARGRCYSPTTPILRTLLLAPESARFRALPLPVLFGIYTKRPLRLR